jgi:hypothetical protein
MRKANLLFSKLDYSNELMLGVSVGALLIA